MDWENELNILNTLWGAGILYFFGMIINGWCDIYPIAPAYYPAGGIIISAFIASAAVMKSINATKENEKMKLTNETIQNFLVAQSNLAKGIKEFGLEKDDLDKISFLYYQSDLIAQSSNKYTELKILIENNLIYEEIVKQALIKNFEPYNKISEKFKKEINEKARQIINDDLITYGCEGFEYFSIRWNSKA